MRTSLAYGQGRLEIDIPDSKLVHSYQANHGAPLADYSRALIDALDHPVDFPALRQALTPDDHITIALDERLPHLVEVLVPLLEYLQRSGIPPEAVTLLCRADSPRQPWLENLPETFQDVKIEIHQAGDRKKLSYLAATKDGQRIYLNRSAVDADQLIVLAQRTFDCLLGYGGGAGEIFPHLSNEEILRDLAGKLSRDPPSSRDWPLRRQAAEVCWLLGSPFFIQVIAGPGGVLHHILASPLAGLGEGERILEQTWHVNVDKAADLVLAGVPGHRQDQAFTSIARAFLAASRIAKPGGQIILLADLDPTLSREAQLLRKAKDPIKAFQLLLHESTIDLQGPFAYTSAANQAKLYFHGRGNSDTLKAMFCQPIETEDQIVDLVNRAPLVALLPDADQSMAVVKANLQGLGRK